MKNRQSVSSKQIPVMKKEGKDTTELMAEMKKLSDEIKVLDAEVGAGGGRSARRTAQHP